MNLKERTELRCISIAPYHQSRKNLAPLEITREPIAAFVTEQLDHGIPVRPGENQVLVELPVLKNLAR
jgi:hypothetical protein